MVDKCVEEITAAAKKSISSDEAKQILTELTRQADTTGKSFEEINKELTDIVALQVKNAQVNKINVLKQKIKIQENVKFFVDRMKADPNKAEATFSADLDFFTDRIETAINTEKYNLNSKFATILLEENFHPNNRKELFRKLKDLDTNKVSEFVAEIAQDAKGVYRDLRSIPDDLIDDYKAAKAIFKMNEHIRAYRNALGVPTEFLQGRIGRQSWDPTKIAGKEVDFKNAFKNALDLDRMGIKAATDEFSLLLDEELEKIADKLVREVMSGRYTDELDLEALDVDTLFKPLRSSKTKDGLTLPNAKRRKIHLKPERWNALMDEFGTGDVLEALRKDISFTSKTAALIKELGPDSKSAWDKTFELVADNTKEFGKGGGHIATSNRVRKRWEALTGLRDKPLNADGALIAKVNDTWRRVIGGVNLGQVVISSIPDLATPGFRQALLSIKPTQNSFTTQISAFADNLGKALNIYGDAEAKRISQVMLEELETTFWDLADDFRFSESFTEDLYRTGSSRVAKEEPLVTISMSPSDGSIKDIGQSRAVAKIKTGISKGADFITKPFDFLAKYNFSKTWTDRRVANTYSSIARDLGSLSDTSYANLAKHNKDWIDELGLGKVWDLLRTKVTTAENGRAYITPDAFKNLNEAELATISKAYLVDSSLAVEQADLALKSAFGIESRKRVLRPGASTKARLQIFEGNRGTFTGEVNRYFSQFKSYPVELVFGNLMPALNKGRFGAIGGFIAIGVALNMVTKTIKDVASNKTPRTWDLFSGDEDTREAAINNWIDVIVSTVSIPFMGELIRSLKMSAEGDSRAKEALLSNVGGLLLGPSGGAFLEAGFNSVVSGSAVIQGEEIPKSLKKDSVEFLKRASGINSTIAAPIINGFFMPTLYELIDPDYIERMEDIAERQGSELIVEQ